MDLHCSAPLSKLFDDHDNRLFRSELRLNVSISACDKILREITLTPESSGSLVESGETIELCALGSGFAISIVVVRTELSWNAKLFDSTPVVPFGIRLAWNLAAFSLRKWSAFVCSVSWTVRDLLLLRDCCALLCFLPSLLAIERIGTRMRPIKWSEYEGAQVKLNTWLMQRKEQD